MTLIASPITGAHTVAYAVMPRKPADSSGFPIACSFAFMILNFIAGYSRAPEMYGQLSLPIAPVPEGSYPKWAGRGLACQIAVGLIGCGAGDSRRVSVRRTRFLL
jgi:hypothetical protein